MGCEVVASRTCCRSQEAREIDAADAYAVQDHVYLVECPA